MASVSSLECDSNKNYIKLIKQNQNYPGEERYTILAGETQLVTTESMIRYEIQTFEYCIDKTTNNQYTLKLEDTIGDGWDNGAWLELQGVYGNILFKGYLNAGRNLEVALSLYTPVEKESVWKFSNSAAGDWASSSYDDSQWLPVSKGSTTATSGTQYFRKYFTGISGLAAYEVRFNYKYGIVAYMNGVEIYRKNMAPGPVTSSTYATGEYDELMYRGIVRTAVEISGSNNVLAVEIHPTEDGSLTSIDFDAWVAVYGQTITKENCYVFPYETTVTAAEGSDPAKAHDWYMSSIYQITGWGGQEGKLTLGMTSTIYPASNAILWYPSGYNEAGAKSYRVGGSNTLEAVPGYTTISTMYSQQYYEKEWCIAPMYFATTGYQYYRFFFLDAGDTLSVPELDLGVCGFTAPTTLELTDYSLDGAVNVDYLSTTVSTLGAYNCSLSSALPAGLVFDSDSCTISGVATEAKEQTSYTMTSHGLNDIQAVFTITIIPCDAPVMEVERVYGMGNVVKEVFKVIDLTTNEAVIDVRAGTSQESETTWTARICAVHPRYEIDLSDNTNDYWYRDSYLNVYTILGDNQREPVLRCNADNKYLALPSSLYVSMNRPLPQKSSWYYMMGSVPANWYDSAVTGWSEGQYGQYPASSNHIQLYKKTFSVSSLANGGGFSLAIAYRYGVVVYMNGHEVFRNHIDPTAAISASTTAVGAYNELMYRIVTLPYKTIAAPDAPAVEYLKEGSNTIAIGLFGINPSASYNSTFDAVIRTLGDTANNRAFNAEYAGENVNAMDMSWAFDGYNGNSIRQNTKAMPSSIDIRFKDDRREWISSVSVQNDHYTLANYLEGFTLLARNSEEEEWTTLLTISGLKWWVVAQKKVMYLANNKPYNMYRFANLTATNSNEAWVIDNIVMNIDRIESNIPDLAYDGALEGYKDIELAESYPTNDKYMGFYVTPALPVGLSLDPASGIIMGTPTQIQSGQVTINARKVSGEATSYVMNVNIIRCDGDRHLITVTVRTDGYPKEIQYKLLEGRGTEGTVIKEKTNLQQRQTLIYEDHCLLDGIFTFVGLDTAGDGWTEPAGYCVSIDQGELRFDMNTLTKMAPPSIATTTFSSYIPFQIDYSMWKVAGTHDLAKEGWNNLGFDDSQWTESLAADIGATTEKVLYVRKVFNIPNLDDYQVMNVRVKYLDGLLVYFNGKRVARFNMPATANYDTPALATHDATVFSKFGFVLSLNGAVVGDNVIAFEMHRSEDVPTSVPFAFDASAAFGVDTCSPLVYSVVNVNSTTPYQGTPNNLFDLYMITQMRMKKEIGSFVSWELETMEEAQFNGFAFFNGDTQSKLFSSLYAWTTHDDEVEINTLIDQALTKSLRFEVETPVGLMGFHSFKYELNSAPKEVPRYSAFSLLYCKANGAMCPGIDNYPAVSEGQISPALCGYGFTGFSYRNCTNGELSEPHNENCNYLFPENLEYSAAVYPFVKDVKSTTKVPVFDNIITEFYVAGDTPLPEGLALNNVTGEISGTPVNVTDSTVYTIVGKNPSGAVSAQIAISVQVGTCVAEEVFPKTEVGNEVVYQCSDQGYYIGSKKRTCYLGESNGVWTKTSGFCMSIMVLVVIIIVVIIVVVVIVLALVKVNKKKSATKGVKGGKNAKATKTVKAEKKATSV